MARKLHRIGTHISRSPKDKHRLPRLSFCIIEQHLPCGHRDDRDRSGFHIAHSLRFPPDHIGSRNREFSVRSDELWVRRAVNFITILELGNSRARFFNDPSEVRTENY